MPVQLEGIKPTHSTVYEKLISALMNINVLEPRSDGRINMPDLFQVTSGRFAKGWSTASLRSHRLPLSLVTSIEPERVVVAAGGITNGRVGTSQPSRPSVIPSRGSGRALVGPSSSRAVLRVLEHIQPPTRRGCSHSLKFLT
jgi:hypothetical protein